MASEIYREPVIGNFKPPRSERRHKNSPTKQRPGMSEAHLAAVRKLQCCVCGKPGPSEAHHLRIERGMGQKAPDRCTVPLCWEDHIGGTHLVGSKKEGKWFADRGIADVEGMAAALWNATGDLGRMAKILAAHQEGGK